MRKRRGFFIILFISFMTISYANDYTDQLLDDSIEEFSRKNYEQALEIIDSVLIVEPDNEIAKMYRKTIKDVITIDKEAAIAESEIILETAKEVIVDPSAIVSESETFQYDSNGHDILSSSVYIGQDTDSQLIIEERIKIYLGLPVIEFKLLSKPMEYDFSSISIERIPIDKILNFDNYCIDFNVGLRFIPFFNINGGFFDVKVGVTNFSTDEPFVVPYIGFDTEVFILSPIAENFIFNSLWVGGGGAIYNLDGSSINNYRGEIKVGIRAGVLNLGWFHNITLIDSLENDSFKTATYGMIIGFNF